MSLRSGNCGLSDGSIAGYYWRLPTKAELSGAAHGTEPVRSGTPRLFSNVRADFYWSSSTYTDSANRTYAATQYMYSGGGGGDFLDSNCYVWPVRSGQ